MATENKITQNLKKYIKKRQTFSRRAGIQIRIAMVLGTLILSILLSSTIIKKDPFTVIGYLLNGAFSRPIKLIFDAAILLGFGIAVIPCFKMRYWNMGANGQVAISSVICIILMKHFGPWAAESTINNIALILWMFVSSVVLSVVWAVIPGIFKAFFNTNETLFTLMMNYVAIGILNYVNVILSNGNSSTGQINFRTMAGWLVGANTTLGYTIIIAIIVILAVFVMIYMAITKEGYEVTVVGDSFKTAEYVAMDTKKIIIRTTALSGVITGIMAFFLVSAINHSATNAYASISFNGILVSWLANFNPLTMGSVSLLFSFIENGMSKVTSAGGLGSNDLVNLVFGLIFFSILVAEFFVRYKVDYKELERIYKERRNKYKKEKELKEGEPE